MSLALCSVPLHSPLSQCCNFTIHTLLFTIHNCSYAFLHMARGHSPLRLAPRSHASGALTAEEWTRQSTSLPCCFFGCLLCLPTLAPDASASVVSHSCFTTLCGHFTRCYRLQPLSPASTVLLLWGRALRSLRSGRFTAFTVTLSDDFACAESLSQLATRNSPPSTFPLERR